MFDFCLDRFIHHNQFLIMQKTQNQTKPTGLGGRKQDGYFIRTYVLSQALLNSPTRFLRTQHIQWILSEKDHASMQEQAELRKTEPQQKDGQADRSAVDPYWQQLRSRSATLFTPIRTFV